MAALEELLYAAALRALEQQERQVADLRSRTGTLLAAAALSASFFGATAIDRAGLSVPVLLGTIALVLATALCLMVLAPVRLSFDVDVPSLHEAFEAFVEDQRLIQFEIAYWLHAIWTENELLVARMHVRFRHASGILAVEVGLWMVALAIS
jgi:hypothetical protein